MLETERSLVSDFGPKKQYIGVFTGPGLDQTDLDRRPNLSKDMDRRPTIPDWAEPRSDRIRPVLDRKLGKSAGFGHPVLVGTTVPVALQLLLASIA